jgi:hypothetical protein
MTLKLPELSAKQHAWLISMATIAYGGAAGALGTMFDAAVNLQSFTLELNKIDYHRVLETALGGAALALFNHWRQTPIVMAENKVQETKA